MPVLYINWGNGSLSAGTYTAATPDIPNGHTASFANSSLAAHSESPWNGQTLAELSSWNSQVLIPLSASTFPASQGRFLIEFNGADNGGFILFAARYTTSEVDGEIYVGKVGGNLVVRMNWNSDSSTAAVDLGTWPTDVDTRIEVIYDSNHATANQRLRARMWNVGASPGSMNNATSTGGTAANTAQFNQFQLAPDGESGGVHWGKLIVSDNINDDLSTYSEGGASIVEYLRRAWNTTHLRM